MSCTALSAVADVCSDGIGRLVGLQSGAPLLAVQLVRRG